MVKISNNRLIKKNLIKLEFVSRIVNTLIIRENNMTSFNNNKISSLLLYNLDSLE